MSKRILKTCDYLKVVNIQNVYLNDKKVTLFNVYRLNNDNWIFERNDYIVGWYKKSSTILDKILNKS